MSHKPILIVDDSPEDLEAMTRAFRRAGLANEIYHCADGDEALEFLYLRGRYAETGKAEKPQVILLDLNLPGTDGREVLRIIKNDPDLKRIPVIVLTTSADPVDIDRCYEMGANTYVQKPVGVGGFVEAIQRLKDYWFEIAILPRAS